MNFALRSIMLWRAKFCLISGISGYSFTVPLQ